MTEGRVEHGGYARQTAAQRRSGGGVGRSSRSYWKHDEIESFLRRQLPILSTIGRGVIIDMHAGDGQEVEHPEPDMFAGGSVKTTAAMTIAYAERYRADAILCEKTLESRLPLEAQFGGRATILSDHRELMGEDTLSGFSNDYAYVFVISDPNGFATQGEEVMRALSLTQRAVDFAIVVNVRPFVRSLALQANDKASVAARKSAEGKRWMLEADGWTRYLGRKQCLTREGRLSNAMHARLFLVSNVIKGIGR